MPPRIASLADYERLRREFRWECPEFFNFGLDVFDRLAAERPHATAIHWLGDECGTSLREVTKASRSDVPQTVSATNERIISFRALSDRSAQVAAALLSSGLKPGDRLLVILPRVIEWWEVMLGAIKAGIVAIPGTTLLTADDIAYRIAAAEIAGVITDAAGADKIDVIAERTPGLTFKSLVGFAESSSDPAVAFADSDHATRRRGWIQYEDFLAGAPEKPSLPRTRGDAPSLLYFTSGTTGYPKMVRHTQASYGLGHQTSSMWLDLTPEDLHWNISDTGWAKAAYASLFGPWLSGAGLFVALGGPKFRSADVIETLRRYPITSFCGPPTIYRMLVQEDLSPLNPTPGAASKLRNCLAAGEPLNPEVISTWREATGLTIRDGYGQTETTILSCNFPGLPIKPGSMGRPSPGFDVAVVDDEGRRLPANEEGEIAVRYEPDRPLGLFQEYWKNPDANATAFRGGWYRTGDRAYCDEDGYLWFVGRGDDVITSSAYRIGPFEVESALIEHPAVVEAAVVGKPDPLRYEIVKAYVVLAAGHTPGDALVAELQEHVKHATSPHKYPREIEFVPDLPKTPSGKIRRVELRDRARR